MGKIVYPDSKKIGKVYTGYTYIDGKSRYTEDYIGEILNHNKGEYFTLMEDQIDNQQENKNKSSLVRKGKYQVFKIASISSNESGVGKCYKLKRKNLLSKFLKI